MKVIYVVLRWVYEDELAIDGAFESQAAADAAIVRALASDGIYRFVEEAPLWDASDTP